MIFQGLWVCLSLNQTTWHCCFCVVSLCFSYLVLSSAAIRVSIGGFWKLPDTGYLSCIPLLILARCFHLSSPADPSTGYCSSRKNRSSWETEIRKGFTFQRLALPTLNAVPSSIHMSLCFQSSAKYGVPFWSKWFWICSLTLQMNNSSQRDNCCGEEVRVGHILITFTLFLGAEIVDKATFTHNFSMPSSGDKGRASLLNFCFSALR